MSIAIDGARGMHRNDGPLMGLKPCPDAGKSRPTAQRASTAGRDRYRGNGLRRRSGGNGASGTLALHATVIALFVLAGVPLQGQNARVGVALPFTVTGQALVTQRLRSFAPESSNRAAGFRATAYPTLSKAIR